MQRRRWRFAFHQVSLETSGELLVLLARELLVTLRAEPFTDVRVILSQLGCGVLALRQVSQHLEVEVAGLVEEGRSVGGA